MLGGLLVPGSSEFVRRGSAALRACGVNSLRHFILRQRPPGPHLSPVSRRQPAHAVLRASIAALWQGPCKILRPQYSPFCKVSPACLFAVQHLLQAEGHIHIGSVRVSAAPSLGSARGVNNLQCRTRCSNDRERHTHASQHDRAHELCPPQQPASHRHAVMVYSGRARHASPLMQPHACAHPRFICR